MTTKNQSPSFTGLLSTALVGVIATLGGCASVAPSQELMNARSAYAEANTGTAGRYAPADVHDARVALGTAEAMHEDDPGSRSEKNFAYVAWRKAQLASAHGDAHAAAVEAQGSEARYSQVQDELRLSAEGARDASERTLDQTEDQLAAERTARIQAEAQLAEAIKSLGEFGKIKADGSNLTITINGAVLFETDKATLLPTAKDELRRVANVLAQQRNAKSIRVYGHTDAVGADAYNLRLSQSRAEAVVAFLVEQGVTVSIIDARGMGETQPIASNDTIDGRSSNRRVEIVVSDKAQP